MDKKTLLAIVICIVVLVAWQIFFTPKPKKMVEHDNISQNVTVKTTTTPSPIVIDNKSAVPAKSLSVQSHTVSAVTDNSTANKFAEPVEFKNDKVAVFFDPISGDIRKASIFGWKDDAKSDVTFNKNGKNNYMRLVTPVASGYVQNVSTTDKGQVISYTATAGGLIVTKEYTLTNGSYLVGVNVKVTNKGNVSLNVPIQVKVGPKLGEGFDSSKYIFQGAIISNKKTTYRVKPGKNNTKDLDAPLWAGYTSKYFLFAAAGGNFPKANITPEDGGPVSSVETSLIANPGATVSQKFQTYIGPKEYIALRKLGLGLQTGIDFGWFFFLAIPMSQILIWLYGIVRNCGLAIIILTIIIKLITLPLTLKGMRSMKAMSKLQPEMASIKEKFKGDPQKINAATMELYKKNKINPMSGCLPLVIQIPIFFALYKSLMLSIELKNAPFFGWITDLSVKDPYYITPIIMGISMFVQQKMTPSTADPMQQKIFLAMPIIFTFLFLNFPAGLVIYWLTNNILSIIQQYFVNKKSA